MVRGSTVLLVAVSLLAIGIWASIAFAAKPVAGGASNATAVNTTATGPGANGTNSTSAQQASAPYGQLVQVVLSVAVVAMIVIFLMLSWPKKGEYLEEHMEEKEHGGGADLPRNEY